MPGFQLLVSSEMQAFSGASGSLNCAESTKENQLFERPGLRLYRKSKPGIPFEFFNIHENYALLEGVIYNREKDEIESFLNDVFEADFFESDRWYPWLSACDGEFVFVLNFHSSGKVLVVNDLYSRLPVYYTYSAQQIVVSRQIEFVRNQLRQTQYSPFALASSLIFGFVPGSNTIWSGLYRMEPSSFLLIDVQQMGLTQDVWCRQNSLYPKDYVALVDYEELLATLSVAMQNRIRKLPNLVLSLSGGLDSRLLAALLAKNKNGLSYFTYSDAGQSASADLVSVQQIVQRLGIKAQHQFVDLRPTGRLEEDELLRCKGGLNYLGMSFILPYLEFLEMNQHPQMTGDGGDKWFADLRPLLPLNSKEDLWKYLFQRHSHANVKQVLAFCKIDKDQFLYELDKVLFSGNEHDPIKAYKRFLWLGRAYVWLFEGEDRNRCYTWSTSPFYSPAVTKLVSQIPDSEKTGGKLFLSLFKHLGNGMENIINPNWKLRPADQKAIQFMLFKQRMKLRFQSIDGFCISQKKPNSLSNDLNSKLLESLKEANLPESMVWEPSLIESLTNDDFAWHLLTLFRLWKD